MKRDILLDTNVIIYYLKYKVVSDFITKLINEGHGLWINDFVLYEFEIGLKEGSKEQKVWDTIKNELGILPFQKPEIDNLKLLTDKYKKIYGQKNKPSVVDAILGCNLLRYKLSNMELLTANHKDFSTILFERDNNILWVDDTEDNRPLILAFYKSRQ